MANSGKTERRKVDVSQVEIITYCHATEDCSKVETSVRNIIHPDLRGYIKLNYTWHEGYYGNPIGVVHVKINSKQQIEAVLSHIAMSLSDLEKSILKTTFDLRFDPRTSRFIIRLSKQDLYYGRFKVVDSDDIVKLVLSFRNAKRRSDVIEYLRRLNITL